MPNAPLIVTLSLDEASQAQFERERRLYYPAALNRIPAHVSLFHALPREELASITETLRLLAQRTPCFAVTVHDLMRLGRGNAYAMASPELDRLHAELRAEWLPWLTPQDRQGFRPHLVVQNKATPQQARDLYTQLSSGFRPFQVTAASVRLWHYEGGPWRAAGEFPLAASRGDL